MQQDVHTATNKKQFKNSNHTEKKMKNTTTVTKERSVANDNVSIELNRVGVQAVTVSSALIGCWAVACLASGMISSGGPTGLVSNFFSALIG
jgi:hypothetical protein